jgi:DNA-binding transcriptional regulator YiaG
MAQQPLYDAETALLHRLVIDPNCCFDWTRHVLEQMVARNILAEDIIEAMTNGHIIFHETKRDILYRVEGKDLDGQRLQVEVALYEDTITIKIITAF